MLWYIRTMGLHSCTYTYTIVKILLHPTRVFEDQKKRSKTKKTLSCMYTSCDASEYRGGFSESKISSLQRAIYRDKKRKKPACISCNRRSFEGPPLSTPTASTGMVLLSTTVLLLLHVLEAFFGLQSFRRRALDPPRRPPPRLSSWR